MATVKHQPDRKFKPTYYVEAYKLAREGLPDHEIAKALGVTGKTYRRWKRRRPAFLAALEDARSNDEGKETLEEYLYDRLTPEMQELWTEIVKFRKDKRGVVKVKELLDDKGVRIRQHLLLHALARTKFDHSQALKLVCVSKKTYDYWCDNDPEFESLVKEMEWHKGNWYTKHFNEMVAKHDSACVLHAMKTYNKDRGYGEKTEVAIDHTHTHVHGIIDFERLAPMLSLDAKRELLAAMDKLEKKMLPEHIEDAEFTVNPSKKGKNNGR